MKELIERFLNEKIYTKRTPLCKQLSIARSDKSTWHNYSALYNFLFDELGISSRPFRLFEMGLGTNDVRIPSNMGRMANPGASVQAFSDFYPNATVYGADIDEKILDQGPKITTFQCNQTSERDLIAMWRQIDEGFDVIIDDGLHETHANICFATYSLHMLKPGGILIIEDILNDDLGKIDEFLKTLDDSYSKILLTLPMDSKWTIGTDKEGVVNTVDNNVAIIRAPVTDSSF